MTETAKIREATFQPETIRVAVIGDIIYDLYLRGSTTRLSPEAPVPVVRVDDEREHLGGAANVAQNLIAMGLQADLFGIIGDDRAGGRICHLCKEMRIGHDGVVVTDERTTTEKVRVMSGHHQIVRYDREDNDPIEAKLRDKIMESLESQGPYQAIIISDYGKGVVNRSLVEAALANAQMVAVDPVPDHVEMYRGCSFLTPNLKEHQELCSRLLLHGSVRDTTRTIIETINLTAGILVTMGGEGMFWSSRAGEVLRVQADYRQVYDVTGAGDTVVAVLTAVAAAGLGFPLAVKVANAAGGEVVGQVGTATVDRTFIHARMQTIMENA